MGRELLTQDLGHRQGGFWGTRGPRMLLSRAGTSGYHRLWGQGMDLGGDAPEMRSWLRQALPRLLHPRVGTWSVRGGAGTPDPSPFFLSDSRGYAQRYGFWKGRLGPRRPLVARAGMAGGGACLASQGHV